jgi:hypothetical protein
MSYKCTKQKYLKKLPFVNTPDSFAVTLLLISNPYPIYRTSIVPELPFPLPGSLIRNF